MYQSMCNFMQNAIKQTALKYLYSVKNIDKKLAGLWQWYITTPTTWKEVHRGGDVLVSHIR